MWWFWAEGEGASDCFGGSEGAEEGDTWGRHGRALAELMVFFLTCEYVGLMNDLVLAQLIDERVVEYCCLELLIL